MCSRPCNRRRSVIAVLIVNGAISLPGSHAAAIDAVVRTRADVVTGSVADQRSANARAQLGLVVVVSPAVLMAVAIYYLHELVPGRAAVLSLDPPI